MRGGEPDASDAVDLGHIAQQLAEIAYRAIMHGTPVGIDVLTEQGHLAHTLFRQGGDFRDDIVERTADLFSTRVGHHAKTAVFAAAFHDGYVGLGTFRARFR